MGSASGRDVWAGTGSGAAGVSAGADAAGSSTSNTEPRPGVLLARAEPWWASAIACTTASPSPSPPLVLRAEWGD